MVKILLFLMMSCVVVLGFASNMSASASTKVSKPDQTLEKKKEKAKEKYKEELSNLTQEEVVANFEKIDKEYNIGEEFSLEDQAFVEMYANPVNPSGESLSVSSISGPTTTESLSVSSISDAETTDMDALASSKYISGSKTYNGITVKVSGYIKANIQNFINQSFGASSLRTSTTAGASKVYSVKTVVYHNAYGLVGSGGVGKVYSGTLSTSGLNTTLTGTKYYTAVVAYASTWCTVTVNHTGGTFTVNPS